MSDGHRADCGEGQELRTEQQRAQSQETEHELHSGSARFCICSQGSEETRESWVHLLTVDLGYLESLPFAPLGVVQYALYCITGLKGYLSLHWERDKPGQGSYPPLDPRETPRAVDYFYHFEESTAVPQTIPMKALLEREVTIESNRASDFERLILRRDAACCVTDTDEDMQACHIIPHSGGDPTILTLSGIRSLDPMTNITEIDDCAISWLEGKKLNKLLTAGLPNHVFSFDEAQKDVPLPPTGNDCAFTESQPGSVLLTGPNVKLKGLYAMLDVRMGKPSKLWPGRTLDKLSATVSANAESTSGDIDTSCKQPEVWLLDVLISAFFMRWFPATQGLEWHKKLTSSIDHKLSDEISKSNKGSAVRIGKEKRARSEDPWEKDDYNPYKRIARQQAEGKTFDQLDRGSRMLMIATMFPNPEAVRRTERERQERRDLEQTNEERLAAWLGDKQSK